MATIEDVAALAKVSVATVSRVMNNSYVVSEEKRKRVLAAARDLDYQPSTFSRIRPKSTNKTLLIICTALIYEVVSGIQAEAEGLGYDVLIHYGSHRAEDLESIKILNEKMVDGIILLNIPLTQDQLKDLRKRCPVVQCGEYLGISNSYVVSINNKRSARDMVRHLLDIGRRRIAFVAPYLDDGLPGFVRLRELGYRLALAEAGLASDPKLVIQADFDEQSAYEAAEAILEMAPRPDAVFCANDHLAATCIHAFKEAGLKVPEDIAVAGFDNDEIAEIIRPPLTTISQPFFEIGCETAKLIHLLINDEISTGYHVMVDHELKIRESTVGQVPAIAEKEAEND